MDQEDEAVIRFAGITAGSEFSDVFMINPHPAVNNQNKKAESEKQGLMMKIVD